LRRETPTDLPALTTTQFYDHGRYRIKKLFKKLF